jgi:CubicO group peptidase (beta-lactamase class C family)
MSYASLSLIILLVINSLTNIAHADILIEIQDEIKIGKHKGVTGAVLSVGKDVLLTASAPGKSVDRKVDIRSVTKSITSLLIGKLIEEGVLKNVNVKVANILPDEFAFLDANNPKRKITIEDILTMRTGLACNDWVPASLGQEDKMYKTKDWAKFILETPIAHEVGKHFSYCTGGVVLLGRVIKKLSGFSVPEYAEKTLFGPLGIENTKWEQTPKGYTDTGGHLRLSVNDLHKIGKMILANGIASGEQVINKKWVAASTKEHTRIYERREQYGYLWWRNQAEVDGKTLTLIYAHGNGGNFVFIIPELELVSAFTGTNFGKREQFIPLQLLSQRIVPALLGQE